MLRWFRNPGLQRAVLLFTLAAALCSAACFYFSWQSGVVVTVFSLVSLSGITLFSIRRYYQLARLSDYLKKINSGKFNLDLQDYAEGEFSILKSEIYKTTVMLRLQAEAVKKEKTALSDAMSDISHQLKTPLTSMLVMTDLLRDPDLPDPVRREFTDKIKNQLERIQWLLTALLKLAKLDAGTVRFSMSRIHLHALLKKALEPLAIPIELKSQNLIVFQKNASIVCDMNWTSEALLNILKNCVEHTPEGGQLEVHCNHTPLYTELLIMDNGSGIPPEDLPHIFERFYRGKNAGADSVGIGLAMAKSIITSQGGYVDVSSKPGQGTCFSIKFFH